MNNNKVVRKIGIECPYLSDSEVQLCWNRAKAMVFKRGNRWSWGAISLIARQMAKKMNDKRLKGDLEQWKSKRNVS